MISIFQLCVFVSFKGKLQRNAYAKTMALKIMAEKNQLPPPSPTLISKSESRLIKGSISIANALKSAGIDYIFGVVGIPVTAIACAAQNVGIRYIGFRNEQAAGNIYICAWIHMYTYI
jgi:hypothetical protein